MIASKPVIFALLLATPVLIAIGQVLFKLTSQRLTASNAGFHTILFDPIFIAALGLYGGATLLWIHVLKYVPLSQAYAFMALTFVAVPLFGFLFLGEAPGIRLIIGTSLIICGLVVVQS